MANGEKLLNEINGFLDTAVKENSNDSEIALPFEAFDDYSTDPVSFNDQSKLMLDKVESVFNLAVKYNRKSSQYLKAVGQLEQGIKFLASGCMTKIALEGKNHELPDLGQLTTDKLFRMASYHYRKIDRALSEYIQEKSGEVDDDLLSMEFRYYNLLNRLRSTEVRIHKYNMNRWYDEKENYDPVINGLAFSEKSWNRDFNRKNLEPASFQKARAFSAQQAVIEGQNTKKSSDKQESSPCGVQRADKEAAVQHSDLDSQILRTDSHITTGNEETESKLEAAAEIKKTEINPQTAAEIKETETNPQAAPENEKTETNPQVAAENEETKTNPQSAVENEETKTNPQTAVKNEETKTNPQAAVENEKTGTEQQTTGKNGETGTDKPPRPHLLTEPPKYAEILQKAAVRSKPDPLADPNETAFTFTVDEIITLARDQEFDRDFPEMAADIRAQCKQMYPYLQ